MLTPDATVDRPPAADAGDGDEQRLTVARVCDGLLDLAVVVLASWTVVYHVSLVVGLDATTATLVEAVLLAGAGAAWLRRRRTPSAPGAVDLTGPARSRAALAVGATAAVAAVLMAVRAPWWLVVIAWLLAAAGGAALAWTELRVPDLDGEPEEPDRPTARRRRDPTAWLALAWATGLAVLSTITLKSNPDDLYYVNLSQWVVDHGTFATRDTIFSDQVYPMASWPPMASYDPLVGVVARLIGTPAGSVAYVLVPPAMTFLAVLALWRLLRTWRVRPLWLALSVALVFLLLDGHPGGYATPGDLFLTRLWQGKVILLCVMVPTLLVHALRYVEQPTRARSAWLLACGTAAVALSTSAIFLVPLLAIAGAAPLLRQAPRAAALGAAAMAAYPLGAGVVTVALGGRSADDFGDRRLYRFDPAWFGHEIFLDGLVAVVGVAAVLLGALLLPRRDARLTTGLLVLAVGVTFVPGVTEVGYDVLGLGPTLWRVSWVATVAALVGVLAASATRVPVPAAVPPRWRRVVVPALGPLVLVGALGWQGVPIVSGDDGVTLVAPPHWQLNQQSVATTAVLLDLLEPGDLVAAPPSLGIAVTVTTTHVKTVAPRKYFTDPLADEPGFDYAARGLLMDYVDPPEGRTPVLPSRARRAIEQLGVDAVCTTEDDEELLERLDAPGFDTWLREPGWSCVLR